MPYPNSEVCDCVSVCILNQILHVSVVNVAVAPKISGLYPKPEARVSPEQLWKEIISR